MSREKLETRNSRRDKRRLLFDNKVCKKAFEGVKLRYSNSSRAERE